MIRSALSFDALLRRVACDMTAPAPERLWNTRACLPLIVGAYETSDWMNMLACKANYTESRGSSSDKAVDGFSSASLPSAASGDDGFRMTMGVFSSSARPLITLCILLRFLPDFSVMIEEPPSLFVSFYCEPPC